MRSERNNFYQGAAIHCLQRTVSLKIEISLQTRNLPGNSRVQELYDCQKEVCNGLENIGKTHFANHELIEQLSKIYNAVLLEQEHQLKVYDGKSKNIMPDENCEYKRILIT